jgi:hypothetical protein
MDITQSVDSIVNNLVRDIETRLNNRVDDLVTRGLAHAIEDIDIEEILNWLASTKLDSLISEMEVNQSTIHITINHR